MTETGLVHLTNTFLPNLCQNVQYEHIFTNYTLNFGIIRKTITCLVKAKIELFYYYTFSSHILYYILFFSV